MPFADFISIREVSSEDKIHCAANLLDCNGKKKWKTEEAGEKSAYVIIEMKTPYSIKGIDIGNEYSAFVEVSVGGPGCPREKFQDILITSSFMTPIESRNGTNPNRVRCFSREALVEETASKKWSLLKVVCSQPFNNNIQYGLSFIKVHVDGVGDASKPPDKRNNSFNLSFRREDSPDSESESANSLFQRWRTSQRKETTAPCTVPKNPSLADIKKPSNGIGLSKNIKTQNHTESKIVEPTGKVADRNRDSLLYTDDDDTAMENKKKKRLEMLEKIINDDQTRVSKEADKQKKAKKLGKSDEASPGKKVKTNSKLVNGTPTTETPKKSPETTINQHTPSTTSSQRSRSPSSSSAEAKKLKLERKVEYRPFHELLRGVNLVISGIQNPARSELRNKALSMGAKYKQDWDASCTHLICAFKNTPKYNQVKGFGKIIKRNWIDDCHSQKKRLPWRRYALDSLDESQPESEDEIFEESYKPKDGPSTSQAKPGKDTKYDDDDIGIYDTNGAHQSYCLSSGSDTEDELQKALSATSVKQEIPSLTKDIYEASTEEEDYVTKRKQALNKSNFFENRSFFISNQISAVERIKVERYIEAFKGNLTNSIGNANYVIANEPEAHSGQFNGEMVKPLWVIECYESETFIPTNRYLVT